MERHNAGEMSSFDEVLWRRAQQGEGGSLASLFGPRSPMPEAQLTVSTIVTENGDTDLVEAIRRSVASEQLTFGEAKLVRVRGETFDFVLAIWPTEHPGIVFLAATVPFTSREWKRVDRWISLARPGVSPFFLNDDDIAEVGQGLERFASVEVERFTARDVLDYSSYSRGWPKRAGEDRPSFSETINHCSQIGASVRSLTLLINQKLRIHLRRQAGATYYNGDFHLFEARILQPLAEAAERRRRLLSGRARTTSDPARPLNIKLSAGRTTHPLTSAEMIKELSKDSSLGVAVLHANPYVHIVVTDYRDGSNFDVFVTQSDAIEIHPGWRASLAALTRLTDQLADIFMGIQISDAPEAAEVSIDDLVGSH